MRTLINPGGGVRFGDGSGPVLLPNVRVRIRPAPGEAVKRRLTALARVKNSNDIATASPTVSRLRCVQVIETE